MNLRTILNKARIVAVVGCSENRFRASNLAALSLVEVGCTVIPVNPKYDTVNGLPCYADFEDIPEHIELDIVNVFRNSAHSAEIVQAVVRRSARTGRRPVIWTQPGVSSPEAEDLALAAGITYVRDECIMVELSRNATDF